VAEERYRTEAGRLMPDEMLNDRRRRRSVRLVLMGVAVFLALIVLAVLIVLVLRASRDKPLDVPVYPAAQLVNHEVLYDGFDHLQYVTSDPFEQVEAFYLDRDGMDCERLYRIVEEQPGQEPRREGHYATRCQVDRSAYGITQFATVLIQPVYDADERPTGQVIVDVQRYWGD
jgi:hypothetical protein